MHQGIVAEPASRRAMQHRRSCPQRGRAAPLSSCSTASRIPHNVGAILRTVDAAGAHGVIRQTRRAAALDAVAAKASAGAVAYVPVVDVVNIARAIEELKALNVWTVGLAGDAAQSYDAVDYDAADRDRARRRRRRDCGASCASVRSHRVDPDGGHVDSLNVSVAAGVVLFEAARQRSSQDLSSHSVNFAVGAVKRHSGGAGAVIRRLDEAPSFGRGIARWR